MFSPVLSNRHNPWFVAVQYIPRLKMHCLILTILPRQVYVFFLNWSLSISYKYKPVLVLIAIRLLSNENVLMGSANSFSDVRRTVRSCRSILQRPKLHTNHISLPDNIKE